MKTILAGLLVVPAMLALSPAQAAPTKAEVDRARAECHRLKLRVQELEAGRVGDPAVSRERARWESACAHANALMDARDGRVAPAPQEIPDEMDIS